MTWAECSNASPSASSLSGKKEKSPFFFGDSLPGTPSFKSNFPSYSVASEDHQFGSTFTKSDSFSIHDNASLRHDGALTRFDSIQSTRDSDHSRGFSFDDTDPFEPQGHSSQITVTRGRPLLTGGHSRRLVHL